MTKEQEPRMLYLPKNEITKLWPVLSNRVRRKECVQQLRMQGVYAITAIEDGPVYAGGVKRQIMICHTLGYFQSGYICDDGPSVDERKQMYAEIERNLCMLLMQFGGIILQLYDAESEEQEEDEEEDNFDQFSIIECEFPTREDADEATQGVLDMWTGLGVDVFDENGKLIEVSSELPNAARTNKSPQKRVPSRLLRTYARLCAEKEEMLAKLGWCNEAGQEAVIGEFQLPVSFWFARRDLMYSTARIAWHEAGLSSDPTDEQIDKWLGGNQLYAVDP